MHPTFLEFAICGPPPVLVFTSQRARKPTGRRLCYRLRFAKYDKQAGQRIRGNSHDHTSQYERVEYSHAGNEFFESELTVKIVFVKREEKRVHASEIQSSKVLEVPIQLGVRVGG